jgi:hypothetical protein
VLVAAAVLPHPPLLVPELGRGADPPDAAGTDDGIVAGIDDLRRRCGAAVDRLFAVDADMVFVVGADVGLRATTFAPWGADVPGEVPEPLPLPALLGGWLTRGHARSFVVLDPGLDPRECAAIGADIAAAATRVALLVMGDGSARHSVKAPGYVDERAPAYDATVAAALADVDPAALLALEPQLADELLVAGRPAWQALAGAAAAGDGDGPALAASEAWFGAPYGVGSHCVTWREAGRGASTANVAR